MTKGCCVYAQATQLLPSHLLPFHLLPFHLLPIVLLPSHLLPFRLQPVGPDMHTQSVTLEQCIAC